jgi:tellurite resistance protein
MSDLSDAVQSALNSIDSTVEQAQQEVQEQAEHQAADDAEAAEAARQSSLIGAMIEAAYIVAKADGHVSESEHATLASTFSRALGDALDASQLEVYFNDAASRFDSEGRDARIEQVAANIEDPDRRRVALFAACAVAWRDGGVGTKDGLALQALARAFDIPIREMQELLGHAHAQLG